MKDQAKQQDIYFRDTEAQQYLLEGEVRGLMSDVDRKVYAAIHGDHGKRQGRRLTVEGIRRKTGLSAMAIILSSYRLVGLGLVVENNPENPKVPKRPAKQDYPRKNARAVTKL